MHITPAQRAFFLIDGLEDRQAVVDYLAAEGVPHKLIKQFDACRPLNNGRLVRDTRELVLIDGSYEVLPKFITRNSGQNFYTYVDPYHTVRQRTVADGEELVLGELRRCKYKYLRLEQFFWLDEARGRYFVVV